MATQYSKDKVITYAFSGEDANFPVEMIRIPEEEKTYNNLWSIPFFVHASTEEDDSSVS